MKELVFVESVASGHGPVALSLAKRAGFNVAFFSQNPDFYQSWGSAEPLAEADRIVIVDTADAVMMLCHVDVEKTVAIIALDDFHLLPASELAESLSLPHPAIEGLKNARFKDLTRNRLKFIGENQPAFQVITENETILDPNVGYPCVVKPVDGTGSVGVRICGDRSEFASALQSLRDRWLDIRDYTLSRRWLAEEFIEGPEFSAEFLWIEDRWVLLGVTEKLLSPPPFCVEIGHVFPATDLPWMSFLEVRAAEWLRQIGLNFGAAHVEFKVKDGKPVLMEINPRLGGDMIPELIRLATGFDVILDLFYQHSNGYISRQKPSGEAQGAAAIRFLVADKPGTVTHIAGKEIVEALPDVKRCVLRRVPIVTSGTENSYDRLGYVIATGNTAEDAKANTESALASFRISYT
jgi:biotin carboxylase